MIFRSRTGTHYLEGMIIMMYRTCQLCGANLDPNEKCDCIDQEIHNMNRFINLFSVGKDGQIKMKVEEIKYGT